MTSGVTALPNYVNQGPGSAKGITALDYEDIYSIRNTFYLSVDGYVLLKSTSLTASELY